MRLPKQVAGRGPGRGQAGRRAVGASGKLTLQHELCLRQRGLPQDLIAHCGGCTARARCWEDCMYQAFGGKEEGTEGPMVSFDPNLFPSTNVAAFFQAKLVMQSALAHCFEVPAAPGYIF